MLDGYPMAKQGRAADALRESVMASFWGGILGVLVLQLFAPPLARVSLMFGPPEYFVLAIFGMTIIASLSEKMIVKGFISGFLGMLIATIGMDPLLGIPRFTFEITGLVDGVMLVPALIGLFSIPEVMEIIQLHGVKEEMIPSLKNVKIGFPTWAHTKRLAPTYLRSSLIGLVVGILPGAGGSIASFMAYNEERRASKLPQKFGTGMIEGAAGLRGGEQLGLRRGLHPDADPGCAGRLGRGDHDGGAHDPRPQPRGGALHHVRQCHLDIHLLALPGQCPDVAVRALLRPLVLLGRPKTPRHILAISIILLDDGGFLRRRGAA